MRQSSFIDAPGFSENLMILQLIKKQRKSINLWEVFFVNISKAFTFVSLDHILWILRKKMLDEQIINIIKVSYSNIIIQLDIHKELSSHKCITVRVKQDEPMLPFLFNIAGVTQLESRGNG